MNRMPLKSRERSCLVLAVVLALCGCREDETRPAPPAIKARTPPRVESSSSSNSNVQPAAPSNAAQQGTAGNAGTNPAQDKTKFSAGYLPPSEHGADVQITEKRLDGNAQEPKGNADQRKSNAEPAQQASPSTGGAVPNTPTASGKVGATPGAANQSIKPSAASTAGNVGIATPAATAAVTRGESADALNKSLEKKLQDFDALMKKAQENAAKERALGTSERAALGEEKASGHGALEKPPAMRGGGGGAKEASGLGNTPDHSGSTSGAGSPTPQARANSIDESDHSDDDIVARQLREAADRESDPVLKQKLWEEYRKYKGGLSR